MSYPWAESCRSMSSAIEYALARNRQVMVVAQPYRRGSLRARHMDRNMSSPACSSAASPAIGVFAT